MESIEETALELAEELAARDSRPAPPRSERASP
jgi:hypothetical protein